MRNLLLTTAVALPMTFGAAFAQDTAPATDPAMETTETAPMETDTMAEPTEADDAAAAASAAEKVEVQQAENEWRVDWITGTSVMSPDGETIGDINDLIVDSETGEMKAAIIGVGGFLGIGEKLIALPWTDLPVN
jgi:sporulation protein YlmC with PRC-barrel domain